MGKEIYISAKKLKEIKKEYQRLNKILSSKLKNEIPKVLYSEEINPEFLIFKENLEILLARKSELETILKNYKLIKIPSKKDQNKVRLGARVLVEVDGQKDEIEIVGPLEADPSLGKISVDSLIGKSLLGHKVGDKIVISKPTRAVYKIKKIKYFTS